MKNKTITTTPDQARALLKTDELNRVTRLVKRGGLLTEPHRKRLRRIIAQEKKKPTITKVKRHEVASADPKSFEGTFRQRLRRQNVYRMRMFGKTIEQMCDELGLGNNTVINDLKAIDSALQKTIDRGQSDAMLNERLANLESLRECALKGVDESEGNERIGYLNTVTKLEDQISRLLQDAGVIKRVHKHELTGVDGKPFILPTAAGAAPTTVIVNVVRDEDSNAAVELFGERPREKARA